MQKLVWQNANGVELDLTSGNYGITEWEGFSNASLNIQSQQVPFQDGGVFLDALIEQRELSVTLAMQDNNNLELRYQQRRELISALNPKLGEGYLIYTNDYISKRIKCIPQIPLFETHNSDTVGTPKASLSWTACSPYWEDLEETVVELPTETPIENNGDVPCQIKAVLNAGASNPILFNRANNKEISLNGIFEYDVEINTNNGKKEIITSEVGFKWETGGIFYSVCYAQGKFIYVGSVCMVYEMLTGKTYAVNIKEGTTFHKIIYADKKFVAVGNGNISISTDGVNWQNVLNITGIIMSVTYGNNMFVAVGGNGIIYTSPDGVTWTSRTSGVNTGLNSIAYNNSIYVVVGNTGTVLTSTNGIEWTSRTSGTNRNLNSVTFAKNIFIAVGASSTIITSSDGISWTSQTIPTGYTFNGVTEGNGIIFALSGNGKMFTSENGTTWTMRDTGASLTYLYDMVYVYKKYYVCGQYGLICTSEDTENWQIETSLIKNNLYDAGFGEGLYIVCGADGLYTSTDGIEWTNRIANTSINSVDYGNGKYIGAGDNGKIYTSTDGEIWTETTLSVNQNFNKIRYVNNMFIIVGAYGTIITSTDGETWVERTSGLTVQLKGIAYGNGVFVVTGGDYSVVSSDGVTWASYSQTGLIGNVTFGNGIFVAPDTRFGGIYTSINGQAWVSLGVTFETGMTIEYKNNRFIGVSASNCGNIRTSKDGRSWKKHLTGVAEGLYGITYGEEKFIFAGNNGIVFNSYIAGSQNIISDLTSQSDMTFNLDIGANEIMLLSDNNAQATLTYRQKYIGV